MSAKFGVCRLHLSVIAPVDEVDHHVGGYDDQIQEIYYQYIIESVVIDFSRDSSHISGDDKKYELETHVAR